MEIAKLADKFAPIDIEWRIQQCGWKQDKPWAMVLAYVTNRAIMQRLDDVCSPFGWCNRFTECDSGAIDCGIGIKCESEWIWKFDAADRTQIEATKGGRSGAMKRAAVQWGIGRYLYSLDTTFAEISTSPPPPQEKPLWHKHYDKEKKQAFFWKNPDLPAWAQPKGE